ncbi:MAG: hypothetical protein JXR60_03575 [Bacteroidales bacterium]|nr:hypothetical protein [Bacteroidales bacterium]
MYISAYSIVTDKQLITNGSLEFTSSSDDAKSIFKDIYKHLELKYPKFHKMDMLCKLGFITAEALLKNSTLNQNYEAHELAIVLANKHSTIHIDTEYYQSIKDKENYFPSPALFVYTLPNIVIGEVAIKQGFKGEIGFLVQEQFDAKAIYEYVADVFTDPQTKACITGWVDIDAEENYKSVLFLVEKVNNSKDNITFEIQKLIDIFNTIQLWKN